MTVNKKEYRQQCEQRWGGFALRDALNNWEHWQDWNVELTNAMARWKSQGTNHLNDFLWALQLEWEPDRSKLSPLLDFEEHFQKVFLRRGLVIYCELILKGLNND